MIILRIKRRLQILQNRGFLISIRILIDILALRFLRVFYGFHPWHAAAPISARPYRQTVAHMVNELKPEVVVEVGCGLGAILSLIQAKSRYGFDLDEGAIRAAKILRSKAIAFTKGDISCIGDYKIDVLILVNWIHEISPEQLESWVRPLLPRTKYLLLDAIDKNNPAEYSFMHDFIFLNGLAKSVQTKRADGEGRQFILYKVN